MWSGSIRIESDPASYERRADWLFTGRRGGVSKGDFTSLNLAGHVGDNESEVIRNRELLALQLGPTPPPLVVINAEHGRRVRHVTEAAERALAPGDAVVTTLPNIALVALAADCAPIVLADTENTVIGAVHCGWRGIVAGVIPAAIDKMLAVGATTQSIQAVVGPAICDQCYSVGQECADQLRGVLPSAARQSEDGIWHADVPGAAHSILKNLGVRSQRIVECTMTNPDLFSHRRDGRTGRQGAAIVIRDGGPR